MVVRQTTSIYTMIVICVMLLSLCLSTGCEQYDKATSIDVDFAKLYASGEGRGITIEEAIQAADSTALAVLASKLNIEAEEVKNPTFHTRRLSTTTERELVGRRRVDVKYYVAQREVRIPKDANPQQAQALPDSTLDSTLVSTPDSLLVE